MVYGPFLFLKMTVPVANIVEIVPNATPIAPYRMADPIPEPDLGETSWENNTDKVLLEVPIVTLADGSVAVYPAEDPTVMLYVPAGIWTVSEEAVE